jgi:hypothetical protein
MKKINFTKNPPPANKIDSMTCFGTEFRLVISSAEWFGTESERLLLIFFHGTEFRAFFCSAERFGTEFREFSVPWSSRNSAGTNLLFRGTARIPPEQTCCSAEQPEFRRNKPVVPSIPSSAELFFVGNCQP